MSEDKKQPKTEHKIVLVCVSCKSCGDTTHRSEWEEGCPNCGAGEDQIIIQGSFELE